MINYLCIFLLCKGQTYLQADQITFSTSIIPKVYSIILSASDKYLTINKIYQFETQEIVIVNFNTRPIDTSILIDDGSKTLSLISFKLL